MPDTRTSAGDNKIVDVRARVMRSSVPEFLIGGGIPYNLDLASTVVEIVAENGVIGRGETTLARGAEPEKTMAQAIIANFKPLILGQDPFRISQIWEELWTYTKTIGFYGPLSAIDQALWDLKARSLGVPLYELMGGRVRDRIAAYATSAIKKDPKDHVEDIRRYIDLGMRGVKLGIGRGVEEDCRLIHMAAEAAEGRIRVAVDANAYYTTYWEAAEVAQACDDAGIFWLEEPLPHSDIAGLAQLNKQYKTPISGYQTETSAARMKDYLDKNALEIYQPRICFSGGITQSKRIAEMCDIFNKMFIPHAFGSGVKNAATLHLIASTRNAGWIEFPVVLDVDDPRRFMTANYLADLSVISMDESGYVRVPDGLGNCVELSEDALGEYQILEL